MRAFHFLGSGTARQPGPHALPTPRSGVPESDPRHEFHNNATAITSRYGSCMAAAHDHLSRGLDLGYAWVSATRQSLERQHDALAAVGIPDKRIYTDSSRCPPAPISAWARRDGTAAPGPTSHGFDPVLLPRVHIRRVRPGLLAGRAMYLPPVFLPPSSQEARLTRAEGMTKLAPAPFPGIREDARRRVLRIPPPVGWRSSGEER